MGQEINQTQFDDQVFSEYRCRLSREIALLEEQLSHGIFSAIGEIGGYELESWLVDHNYFPSPINQAFLTRLNNPLVVHELSRFNVELNNTPMPLKGNTLSAIAFELNQN